MYITQEFEIPASIEDSWKALIDIEDAVQCMPGAKLTQAVDGKTWRGTMDFRLGAIHLMFEGDVRVEKSDPETRTILMWAQGRESKARGTGQGTITSTLMETDGGTKATVTVYLKLAGQIAQFGRGLIEGEAERLVAEFAECLSRRMTGEAGRA
jgi:carbon monoxide dehydrogenase subunit G